MLISTNTEESNSYNHLIVDCKLQYSGLHLIICSIYLSDSRFHDHKRHDAIALAQIARAPTCVAIAARYHAGVGSRVGSSEEAGNGPNQETVQGWEEMDLRGNHEHQIIFPLPGPDSPHLH